MRFVLPSLLLAIVGLAVQPASGEMLILLREESNQLRFWSTLLAGHHNIVELPLRDRSASAQVFVEPGDGPMRLVRQFRVESWDEFATPQGNLKVGFVVQLEPTRVADRYRLIFDIHRAQGGKVVTHQYVLRRGIGMFYLSVLNPESGDTPRVIARSKSFVEMMLDYPQVYRAWEETAQHCSLPGVQLVPESRYSPTVIEAVMGEPIEVAASSVPETWPQWVAALDADEYGERRAALDALLHAGPDVVRYLRSLPVEKLSPEQRAQIAYVTKSYTVELPAAPQPLQAEDLRALQEQTPSDWLARLVLSADERVRDWALGRLERRGISVPRVPTGATLEQRKQLAETIQAQLPQSPDSP